MATDFNRDAPQGDEYNTKLPRKMPTKGGATKKGSVFD